MVKNILCDIKITSVLKLVKDWVSAAKHASVVERASEASSAEQANE